MKIVYNSKLLMSSEIKETGPHEFPGGQILPLAYRPRYALFTFSSWSKSGARPARVIRPVSMI